MYKKVLCLFLVVILTVSASATQVQAFRLNGRRIDTNRTYVYFAHRDFSNATFTDMNHALYRWSVPVGHNVISRHPTQRHTLTDFNDSTSNDTLNVIYRIAVPDNYIAVNRTYFSGGIIHETDINFNTRQNFANSAQPNCWDAYSIFLHEIGHTYGIADEDRDTWDSVMFGLWGNRTNTIAYRVLRQDDINAARAIY